MDAKQLFNRTLAQATVEVESVAPSDLDLATPDNDWDVQALVNHMLYQLVLVPEILSGKTMDEIGSKYDQDLIGIDLETSWNNAVQNALEAVDGCEMGSISYSDLGSMQNSDYLSLTATDLLIHSWDLGIAIGRHVEFDPEVTKVIYAMSLPKKDDLYKTGLFAPPIPVSASAPIQEKLLSIYGRDQASYKL